MLPSSSYLLRGVAKTRVNLRRVLRSPNSPRPTLVGHRWTTTETNGINTSLPSQAQVQELRLEVQQLQSMIRDLNRQQRVQEGILDRLFQQSTEIQDHVQTISTLERVTTAARDYVKKESDTLRRIISKVDNEPLRTFLGAVESKSRGLINRYSLAVTLVGLAAFWRHRTVVYDRTSEEVADIAVRTLRQGELRNTIQETLRTVANSPETLETLNLLVQKLIRDQKTLHELVNLVVYALGTIEVQRAVLRLLDTVFKDPHTQKMAGQFLVKGLDEESVRKMLDAQTQALARRTVSNEKVQQDTGAALRKALRYAATPTFFGYGGSYSTKDDEEDDELLQEEIAVQPPPPEEETPPEPEPTPKPVTTEPQSTTTPPESVATEPETLEQQVEESETAAPASPEATTTKEEEAVVVSDQKASEDVSQEARVDTGTAEEVALEPASTEPKLERPVEDLESKKDVPPTVASEEINEQQVSETTNGEPTESDKLSVTGAVTTGAAAPNANEHSPLDDNFV